MSEKSKASFGSESTLRIPISALKADPRNPRRIDKASEDGLAVSLETFGALDIVFNEATGELVSGHQRVAQLKRAGASEVVRIGESGHIVHPKTGDRFPVRFVNWDTTKQRMANLVANNPHLQGEFTEDAIEQARELEDEAHFHELQLDKLISAEEGKEKEHEPATLEDFDTTATPKKAWILVATSADRLPEIESALRAFEDEETRVEVSNV